MRPKRVKVLNSHAAYARFLAECDPDSGGVAATIRHIARIPEIYNHTTYSPTHSVSRHNGREVIAVCTANCRYEVFDVSDHATYPSVEDI